MTRTHITVAIPFRPGCLDREIHADYVATRLKEMLPEATHMRVDVEGTFSRARVRNEAVRRAKTGIVVLCDADTLPEEQPLRAAIKGAARDGRLHLPYTTFRGLGPEATLAVYARDADPHQVPAQETSRRPIGGVWVIDTQAYWKAGGMDEKFIAWGFEDDAFWTAAGCLLGESVRHTGVITHLHHTSAAVIGSPSYKANRARFAQYQRARRNPEQMRRLTGTREKRLLDIVAIAHYYPPEHRAGAEIMLHELLKPLAAKGHNVQVWATDEDTTHDQDGIIVHPGHPDVISADVVISHLKSVRNAHALARQAGAQFVQVLHSSAQWIAQDLRLSTQLLVANSKHVSAALRLRGRGPNLVVHPPVWAHEHRTTPGRCVTLINPLPAKGSSLFYALAERMPDVPFLAVEGGYQSSQQVRRPDLPNVTWVPHTQDMRTDVWSKTRVLLMPSIQESYGMVAVEAAASGIPTIAHPTKGLREALANSGTFIDRADIDAWEDKLRHLLAEGYEQASALARKRSGELDPNPELTAWVQAVEQLGSPALTPRERAARNRSLRMQRTGYRR